MPLHHHRADDAPPYATIFIVGHVVMPAMLLVDMNYEWPIWLNSLIWPLVTVGLALIVLPLTKGALIGLQWALRMHGFAGFESGSEGLGATILPAARGGSGQNSEKHMTFL